MASNTTFRRVSEISSLFLAEIRRLLINALARKCPTTELAGRKSPQALLLATRSLPVNLTDDAKFECSTENGLDEAARAAEAEVRSDAPSAPPGRRCERQGISRYSYLPSTRHCVPSRIPPNSFKTKDGAPFYPSRKRSPFQTPFLASASRFERQN